MAEPGIGSEEELRGELRALLQLDRDAAAACARAAERLRQPRLRSAASRFGEEHAQHVDDLLLLLRNRGSGPGPEEPSEGSFQRAIERASEEGDGALVEALRAGERVVRDQYLEALARTHPTEVKAVLRRAVADEDRHYGWAAQARTAVAGGVGAPTWRGAAPATTADELVAKARAAALSTQPGGLDVVQPTPSVQPVRPARPVEASEAVEAVEAVDLLSTVVREVRGKPFRSVLIAAGLGFLVGRVLRWP